MEKRTRDKALGVKEFKKIVTPHFIVCNNVMKNSYIYIFSDTVNSKYSNRRNGKTVVVQPQRAEASRNTGFKKNSNNCKQPQPRASLFCRKKSSEVCLQIKMF